MSLKVKNKKGPSLPPIDGGTYPAVCVGVVDLGEQYNEKFKDYKEKILSALVFVISRSSCVVIPLRSEINSAVI